MLDGKSGEIITHKDIEAGEYVEEYLEILLNNPKKGDTFGMDFSEYGFEKLREDVSGVDMHTFQTEKPEEVFETLKDKYDVIFQIDDVGPWALTYNVWGRDKKYNVEVPIEVIYPDTFDTNTWVGEKLCGEIRYTLRGEEDTKKFSVFFDKHIPWYMQEVNSDNILFTPCEEPELLEEFILKHVRGMIEFRKSIEK